MKIKVKNCCVPFGMMTKKMKLSNIFGNHTIYRVLLYIDTVLVRNCPQCGTKVEYEVIL